MTRRTTLIGCAVLALKLAAGVQAPRASEPEPTHPPNIVVILADDLGYGDVQCYNRQRGKIPTLHIDRLASQGMLFTDAHSSSGVCSPSRYTLLTGRYHWRTRLQAGIVGEFGRPLIAPDRLTIAGLLARHGYRTACVGKWHLGWDWPIPPGKETLFRAPPASPDAAPMDEQRAVWRDTFVLPIEGGPTTRGFTTYFGTDVPNWPPYCFIENNRTKGIPSEFLPGALLKNNLASLQGPALPGWRLEAILPALADRACGFIEQAAIGPFPFFLYLPLTAPHTPLAVNAAWRGKSGLNPYADLVMETDAVVGRVLAALERSGTADHTLVFFTSDNGCAPYIGLDELKAKGHFPSGPLRGYKSDVWEGGHRVPFIVRWPGVVRARARSDQLVLQADLMATCAEILDTTREDGNAEDSCSLLPLLKGMDKPVRESAVTQSAQGLFAIRKGPWKLILGPGSGGWGTGRDDQPAQLYNLADDLAESRNLHASRPDVAAELTALMESTVSRGRSTSGAVRRNDVPVNWRRFLPPAGTR
jgi:arylsulfatase A-like enzyme